MHRAFWAGALLLLFLILASVGVERGIQQANGRTLELLEQAGEQAFRDMAEAEALFTQAQKNWQRWRKPMAGVSDHEPMEQIDVTFAEAAVWAGEQKPEEFSVACAQLMWMIRSVTEDHRLTWWNLLGIRPILQRGDGLGQIFSSQQGLLPGISGGTHLHQ